jgi:hypothetical protein
MRGRWPTGRVWTRVFSKGVDGWYIGSSVDIQPKYGCSRSRPGVVHRDRTRVKLSRLSDTQTPHSNSVPASVTEMASRPRTKKCSSLMMHRSCPSVLDLSPARDGSQ